MLYKLIKSIVRRKLQGQTFCVISNDCWGAEIYRHLNLPYQTPFVGLYIMAPCYINLLENIEKTLFSTLTFKEISKYTSCNELRLKKNYPIGVIGDDIEIHFLHYHSKEEAFETWNKRLKRIDLNHLFVKLDSSKDLCTPELTKRFIELPFKNKLIISSNKDELSAPFQFNIPNWELDGAKMYKHTWQRVNLWTWILKGETKSNLLQKTLYTLYINRDSNLF